MGGGGMSAPGMLRALPDGRADWQTPPALYDQLDAQFAFQIDGAADEFNHLADVWYGSGGMIEDAFKAEPINRCIFANPPYGKLRPWMDLFRDWGQRNTVVALLPSNTDTEWFATMFNTADEIRFLRGRVQFVGTTSSNPNGSLVAIWRPNVHARLPYVWLWNWRSPDDPLAGSPFALVAKWNAGAPRVVAEPVLVAA